MSLRSDFSMYFSSTVLGLKKSDGSINPFHVFDVTSGSTLSNFQFTGVEVLDAQGRTRETAVSWGDLETKLPNLGYIRVDGEFVWLSYCQRKTVKKGVCALRIEQSDRVSLTAEVMWQLYHPSDHDLPSRDFLHEDSEIFYKGFKIGTREGNTISIIPSAEFLMNRLAEVSQCQISIQ